MRTKLLTTTSCRLEWDGAAPRTGRPPVRVDPARLKTLFGVPQPEAARILGISLTALKQVCRKAGISRWPYLRRIGKPRAAALPAAVDTAPPQQHLAATLARQDQAPIMGMGILGAMGIAGMARHEPDFPRCGSVCSVCSDAASDASTSKVDACVSSTSSRQSICSQESFSSLTVAPVAVDHVCPLVSVPVLSLPDGGKGTKTHTGQGYNWDCRVWSNAEDDYLQQDAASEAALCSVKELNPWSVDGTWLEQYAREATSHCDSPSFLNFGVPSAEHILCSMS